jgi:hypothetical protein
MRHTFRSDFAGSSTLPRFEEAFSLAKHAAIWLLISFFVTALVWSAETYGGLSLPDGQMNQVGRSLSATPAIE